MGMVIPHWRDRNQVHTPRGATLTLKLVFFLIFNQHWRFFHGCIPRNMFTINNFVIDETASDKIM